MPLAPRFGISPKPVSGQCDDRMLHRPSCRLQIGYELACSRQLASIAQDKARVINLLDRNLKLS